jgi:hypothetical protein
MNCNCAELEAVLACGDDEQAEFVRPKQLRLLRQKKSSRLYICPACGTYWQVDHMQRGPLAMKVSAPFAWERYDDSPERLGYLERLHGGVGHSRCIQQGCGHAALKGMFLCVRHAFPEVKNEG